jgi:acetylornithine deacetylase/succinyl-diaminopimelate desuccinylase-like protein
MSSLTLTLLFAAVAGAQDVSAIMGDAAVKAALDAARRNEARVIDEQARICEIPAPPFKEDARGKELERLFRAAGLRDVRVDKAGNVIGARPGAAARPNVVIAAHLDTVFPEETNVRVTREGAVLKGPGIGDDCRGLAMLLGIVRALDEGKVRTPGTITFVADTGEEGLGDLRGMKSLFGDSMKGQIDKFVSIDGNGLSITNRGVGSLRYRVGFSAPGGHSYGAFGNANPIQAMGRAIAKIDAIEVPAKPKTTYNVGRVGGGTSVNAIPFESWMEVDMRSEEKDALETLHAKFKAAVADAVADENKRWNNKGAVAARLELVGDRPVGTTAESSAIVQTAIAVNKAFGSTVTPSDSSTDSNVPMSLGIPAITIGGGGRGAGSHSPGESWDSTDSYLGTQRAVVLLVALAR